MKLEPTTRVNLDRAIGQGTHREATWSPSESIQPVQTPPDAPV